MLIKTRSIALLKSSWFITLVATTLGVLLALYLNNLESQAKLEKRKNLSIQNLHKELSHNESLIRGISENDMLIDLLTKIRKIDRNISTKLTTSVISMTELVRDYSNFIEVVDSTYIDGILYKYDIIYTFELNLDDLQSIAWETTKMSNVVNELDYNCLQTFVKIYSLQKIFVNEQQKILNYFVNANHNKLLSTMLIVQQLKSQLLDAIIDGQNEIKNCN